MAAFSFSLKPEVNTVTSILFLTQLVNNVNTIIILQLLYGIEIYYYIIYIMS